MSDLISRNDVIQILKECNLDETLFEKDVFDKIMNLPTAHNVDKVVEQLNKIKKYNLNLADMMLDIQSNGTNRHFICLEDAIKIVKAGYDTKNNPRREAYLKALEDYHDSVQDRCIKWASTSGRRERQLIPYLIKESNTIFQMLKVGASEIE